MGHRATVGPIIQVPYRSLHLALAQLRRRSESPWRGIGSAVGQPPPPTPHPISPGGTPIAVCWYGGVGGCRRGGFGRGLAEVQSSLAETRWPSYSTATEASTLPPHQCRVRVTELVEPVLVL